MANPIAGLLVHENHLPLTPAMVQIITQFMAFTIHSNGFRSQVHAILAAVKVLSH